MNGRAKEQHIVRCLSLLRASTQFWLAWLELRERAGGSRKSSINCWSASCSQVGAGAKGMTGVVGDCEGKPQLGGHQCEAGHGAHQGVHLV